MFEGITCVYRSNIDLFFYVFGSSNENEVNFFPFPCCLIRPMAHVAADSRERSERSLRSHCNCSQVRYPPHVILTNLSPTGG